MTPNYVPYATTSYDPAAMQGLPVNGMSSDVITSQQSAEQLVNSLLQQDDDVAPADDNNGNHTLECTDYNHSPTIVTNFMEETLSTKTDATSAEQTTSSDQLTKQDNFISEMTSDTCNSSELELSDNYLTFLA